MTLDISRIFCPSRGVELAFDLNSLYPTAKSSIIHDTDHDNRRIVVAQPMAPVTPGATAEKEMHITTLLKSRDRTIRLGIKCRPVSFDNNYRLSEKVSVGAIILQYTLPVFETNIRSAYRLPLSKKYAISATMTYKDETYTSGSDFFIRDISVTGLGILIPGTVDNAVNLLSKAEVKEKADVDITLFHDKEKLDTVPVKTAFARIHSRYSDSAALAGLNFTKLRPAHEEILHRFIHNAQIDELKRISGI
ncbi:MAG: PilZ domain-containing protein [Desulfobacteraceae bacterium]